MRFHFGVSFRPTKIFKYIGLGFLGLLAFMGVHDIAKAETIDYTGIVINQSNNNTSLSCNYNSAGMCPTNISMFPQPPKTEYLMKYLYISFANNELVNGHNYNFQIQYHIIRPTSDNNFEQESFRIYLTNNTLLSDNTIYWNQSNYYDSMYAEEATQFNYSGSFTATNTLPFYVAMTMENQEGMYGLFIDSVYLFDNDTGQEIIDSSTQNTIDIMNNQNQNTQNVINNNNSNTQEIKDTINDNLQSCRDSLNLYQYGDFSGSLNNWYFVVKPLLFGFENQTTYTLSFDVSTSVLPFNVSIGYGNDQSYLVDGPTTTFTTNGRHYMTFTTNRTDYSNLWIRIPRYSTQTTFTYNVSNIMLSKGNMVLPYEPYGQQICSSKIDNLSDNINNTNQSIQDLNDTISDDTIDTSTSNDFFDNFEDNHHGLTGIVSLPLTTIQSLNNATCTPLSLTIPFVNQNLQLPCLTPIYQENFGNFFTLYQTIIFGLISYYVCISIFYMVKDFKDPNKDKIEVMDL